MPSGHGSGGHFGGGSFGSHSGGHRIGSHSNSHSSSHSYSRPHSHVSSRGYVPANTWHGWRHPHVTVFCGRQVYLDSGRAGATSVLLIFLILGIIVSIIMGLGWAGANEDLDVTKKDYAYYNNLAMYASNNPDYQIEADVTGIEQHEDSDKWCVYYVFKTSSSANVEGYSFCVYSYEDAHALYVAKKVTLALDTKNDSITGYTDSVPLDYKDVSLEDHAEYADFLAESQTMRNFTFVSVGITAVLGAIAILIPLTAKKPTAEQLAESKNVNNETSTTNSNSNGATSTGWRCVYCNTLNDNSKNSCDGCGAKRQN